MAVRYRNSLNVPPILVDIKAYEDMLYVARSVKVEVAWFCEVERLPDGTLIVGKVHLPDQQSSSTTVEIEPDDLFKFADAFIAEHGAERYNTLRAWGHSHHTMGVSPSGQDQKMLDWMIDNNGSEFFIAIRINHAGDMQIDYATRQGLTFEDANYTLGSHPERQEWWAEQVKDRLRPITYAKATVVYPATTQPFSYQGTGGAYQGSKAVGPLAKQPTKPPPSKQWERSPSPTVWDDEWNVMNPADWGAMIESPAERSKAIDGITLDDLTMDMNEIMEAEVPDALVMVSDAIDDALWDKGINHLSFPQEEMWGYAQRKYEEIYALALELNGGTHDDDPTPPA